MAVDFGKVFGPALKYPLRKDVYFLLFAFTLIFGLPIWFLTGYFLGDIGVVEGIVVAEIIGTFTSYMIYLAPVTIISWLIGIFLMAMYFDNSMWFYNGKGRSILESFEIAKGRFFSLMLTSIVIILIFAACFGGAFLFIIFSFLAQQTNILLVIGVIWFFIGSIIGAIVMFTIFLAPIFCVLEKTGPMDSIKKSWNLIMKNKLNTFIFLIIYFVIFIVIWMASSIPETVFIFVAGQYSVLSFQSLSFFILRTFFTAYLTLFAYSSYVNYYITIKK
ncbi:MAG: hypothetical protein V3U72_00535 [Candidatus Aenigmarchaeota archaeon]